MSNVKKKKNIAAVNDERLKSNKTGASEVAPMELRKNWKDKKNEPRKTDCGNGEKFQETETELFHRAFKNKIQGYTAPNLDFQNKTGK